ncbi:hypothetical protein M0R36_10440 [bacterium]|nr:hypothetical protein [bacterium]
MGINTDTLLFEYRENREKIKSMILELEQHIEGIKTLMPTDSNDFRRNKHLLEGTLRTITEFYKLIFDMRKEIGKLVKDEISIVEKLDSKEEDDDVFKRMSIIDKFLIETGVTIKDINKVVKNKNDNTFVSNQEEENKDE